MKTKTTISKTGLYITIKNGHVKVQTKKEYYSNWINKAFNLIQFRSPKNNFNNTLINLN